jgi:uncharacterized protein (DUF58 family)
VTRAALPKLRTYAVLAAGMLVGAITFGRPELVALAVPFVGFLAVGLARAPAHDVTLMVALERERATEGDDVALALLVTSRTAVARLALAPGISPGLEIVGGAPRPLSLAADEERSLSVPLRCRRWGRYEVGAFGVSAYDSFGLIVDEQALEPRLTLRVYPAAERLQRLLRPLETQPFAGNQVARTKGDGIEHADIRPFVPGDRLRRINWRASARRQALLVNESHPERNADVVLFLDTFAEAGPEGDSTLDQTVRAATALAEAYLRRRDRVGVVSFGGVVRWLTPASGGRQLYRVVESLLDTRVSFSYVSKTADLLPPRSLPPQSLVVALTPLLDRRALEALADLRGRGFDLALIDVSPIGQDSAADVTTRFWRLWRDALRYRYERLGVPVVEWRSAETLVAALEEVRSFRRYARRVRAF